MTRSKGLSVTFTLFAATAFPGVVAHAQEGPTVNTTDGPVRGFVREGVRTFLGIPPC
jgi:hypothetical protein